MNNEKLQKIGNKLNVSEKDLKELKKEKLKSKYLYPITEAFIAGCSTILGYFAGKNAEPRTKISFYPAITTSFTIIPGMISNQKGKLKFKKNVITHITFIVFISLFGFLIAYRIAQPEAEAEIYHRGALYDVYSKKRN